MKKIYEDEKIRVFAEIPHEYINNIIDVKIDLEKNCKAYGWLTHDDGIITNMVKLLVILKDNVYNIENYLINVLQNTGGINEKVS